MQVTLEIPDALAERLTARGRELPRAVFESLVLEQYREGEISRGRLAELLGLNFWESEAFLRERAAGAGYSSAELAADRAATEKLARA